MLPVSPIPVMAGFTDQIRRLCMPPDIVYLADEDAGIVFAPFTQLKATYVMTEPSTVPAQFLTWCASDIAKRYCLETDQEHGRPELYCWPDFERHPEAVEKTVVKMRVGLDFTEMLAGRESEPQDSEDQPSCEYWPLVVFPVDESVECLLDRVREGVESGWEPNDEESSSDSDEYESDFVDDSEIEEIESEPDDDGLVVEDESGEDEGDVDGTSPFGGFSPVQGSVGCQPSNTEYPMAQFSSPEPDSSTLRGSNSDESDSEGAPLAASGSTLKRERESSSENDSEDEAPRKRARIDNRRNFTVVSDDEDEEVRKVPASRRARVVDSDDDEDDGGVRETPANHRARVIVSDDEDEEDASANDMSDGSGDSSMSGDIDGSDPEAGGTRPLTFAQRLEIHRQENPIPLSGSDNSDHSDMEEMSQNNSDAPNYGAFQDDEEANECSNSGGDDEPDGLMMDNGDDGSSNGYD
ncbi:hypothetical protein B0T26DRAFT_714024 [Lasiosphaeria miniovina]|uniref:Uncharacterized protein n=1 Tax=Lasiosphaeria miniovina TaxID=1954250 RepID=A0AA40DT06_9PEZI|nr:uncharacterized protein B0T26DRAFT_714024 [Lasiosphaeria miniovina]KAK0712356.1 hypothetical protein B0T26DRAFT_714024 [Lasiosphaeria miniovina]